MKRKAPGTWPTGDNLYLKETKSASLLSLHARVYGTAEKYDVDALKALSSQPYLASLAMNIEVHDFITSIHIVYAAKLTSNDLRKGCGADGISAQGPTQKIGTNSKSSATAIAISCPISWPTTCTVGSIWFPCCGAYVVKGEDWCACDLYA
jgi:hypothetical protein